METKTNKILRWTGLLSINIVIILIVIFLQMLYYGTSPAIDYDQNFTDNFERKEATINKTIDYNRTLIIEALVGGCLLTLLNYLLLKSIAIRPFRVSIILLLIYLILTGTSLTFFTIEYFNNNVRI